MPTREERHRTKLLNELVEGLRALDDLINDIEIGKESEAQFNYNVAGALI